MTIQAINENVTLNKSDHKDKRNNLKHKACDYMKTISRITVLKHNQKRLSLPNIHIIRKDFGYEQSHKHKRLLSPNIHKRQKSETVQVR